MAEGDAIEIECPTCSGAGCEECSDGIFNLEGCPNSYCSDMVTAIDLIDCYHKGMAPVGGGTLDQSAWFLRAARFLRSEESAIKAEQ